MWLDELVILNYKSCKSIDLFFSKDEPNVLIGINDCGKSTILKAIGLLLSPKPIFSFPADDRKKTDLSNARISKTEFNSVISSLGLPGMPYDEKQCVVLGKFILEDEDRSEERLGNYTPTLQWAIDKFSSEFIWVTRSFDESASIVKDSILTKDALTGDGQGNAVPLRLYTESAANLKNKAKELQIGKEEIENENKVGRFKNVEYVNAIYKKFKLVEVWSDYSIKEDKSVFPEYKYLDWNMSMEQLQDVAKSAISNKISTYVDSTTRFAKEQSAQAQLVVDRELDDFRRQFAVDLPNIRSLKSNIVFSVDSLLTDILINKENTDGDIHLDSQGDGIKRQIWFALIKWTALSSLGSAVAGKKFIWCFDEPETHLYPGAQRSFFQIIKSVSAKNIQSIISTHSTVFIDRADFSRIKKFELCDGYTKYSDCDSAFDVFDALQIRNSDFLFYDRFIIVEGDTEATLIPFLFKLRHNETLDSRGIQLLNLGGKDKRRENQQLLKDLLKDFNKEGENIVYLFDNDAGFEMTKGELNNTRYYLLGRQDIEDSISNCVWVEIVNEKFKEYGISITDVEVQDLKDSIPNDAKVESNQKFYRKLRNYLKKKISDPEQYYLIDDNLPEKGKSLGALLSHHIHDLSVVDKNIEKAFDKLNN